MYSVTKTIKFVYIRNGLQEVVTMVLKITANQRIVRTMEKWNASFESLAKVIRFLPTATGSLLTAVSFFIGLFAYTETVSSTRPYVLTGTAFIRDLALVLLSKSVCSKYAKMVIMSQFLLLPLHASARDVYLLSSTGKLPEDFVPFVITRCKSLNYFK